MFTLPIGFFSSNSSNHPAAPTVYSVANASASYIVPAGVTVITVEVWAGGGAGGLSTGGGSGYVKFDMIVNPGQTLSLIIGGGGTGASSSSAIGGGGIGRGRAGGGGGRSEIRSGATLVGVAAGGGGSGYTGFSGQSNIGGAGGGTNGTNGAIHNGTGGGGGTQIGGGNGGTSSDSNFLAGSSGVANTGGDGAGQGNSGFGGGGGGGYFGGGGGGVIQFGDGGSGGGGSGYYNPAITTNQTLSTGSGSIPPATDSIYYAGLAGVGGNAYPSSAGNDGRIVIY